MKNPLKFILFALLFSFILNPINLSSQDSNLGNWYLAFGNKKINDKLNWHHEVQYRNYNFIGDLEQLLIRTGVGYNLSENNNNLLLGYGYIRSENYTGIGDNKNKTDEHRIYQQFITKQKFNRVSIQHRYRFEQRILKDDFRLRFRYFLAMNVALNNPQLDPKTFYLSGYNELFINTDNNIFGRNRIYGGLGYKLNKAVRFELGYMNQVFDGPNRDQLNMVVFISY